MCYKCLGQLCFAYKSTKNKWAELTAFCHTLEGIDEYCKGARKEENGPLDENN